MALWVVWGTFFGRLRCCRSGIHNWQGRFAPAACPQGRRPRRGVIGFCLGQFLLFRGVWSGRWEMSDRLLLVAWAMSDNPTDGELKCLTGHNARNECPTMKQMGNRANKGVAGDESRCVLRMRLAGEHSNLRFRLGGSIPYFVSGLVACDRVLMCVQQLVSCIRVPI